MAVEESIIIKIQANAEEFKVVSNIINTELGKLGKSFKILDGDIEQTSATMNKFGNSSKKFNKGIMSISLILQDLPYGFRGIQNNIPALAQGFGVVYLAISAVTAAMTYFVLEGDKMSKGTKDLFDSFKTFINGVVNDLVNALYPAFKSITDSIKYLWNMFGENIMYQFKVMWDNLLAFLKIVGNILAEAFNVVTSLIKGDWSKFGESLLNIFKLAWNGIVQFLAFALKQVGNGVGAFVKIFNKDLGTTILKSVDYTANQFAEKFKFAFKEVETNAKKIDVFSLFGKKGKDKKVRQDTSNLDKLKALEQYNKDDLFLRRYYALEVLKEEERLTIQKAISEKASGKELQNIRYEFNIRRLTVEREVANEIQDIRNKDADNEARYQQKLIDNANRVAEMQLNMRFDLASALAKINSDFAKEDIKNSEAQLAVTLKATRGNYQAQKAAIEEAIAKLKEYRVAASEAGYGTKEFDDAIKKLGFSLEGLVDPIENFNNALNDIIKNTITELGVSLGESIANSLLGTGGLQDALSGFLSILAGGLIEVGKLAIATGVALLGIKEALKTLNPYVAIAAGVALVALGSYVKGTLQKKSEDLGGGTKKFANGGIISGPTMGLMGEYPGARNNPEVVAPLDKLKGLIGNSGGTLEARISGNDLLILLNKAQRNNQNTF